MSTTSFVCRPLSLAFGAVLALVAHGGETAVAQEYTWRIQSNLNEGDPGQVALREGFADTASRMSGGRMAFEVYPVGALYPVADGLEAVGAGVTEMALLTGGYYSGKVGPIAILETGVPGSLRTPVERYNFFYRQGFLELAREAYAPFGVYYLGPQLSSSWDLMSKTPITSAEDFDGLKVRAFGIEADWFAAMGASPVFMGGGEIYTALATGVIDAARWSSPAGNFNSSFHEVAKYYVQPSAMPVPNNFFAVNQAAWEGLPDDLKAILEEAAIRSSLEYLAIAIERDAKALEEMKAAGVEVVTIPDDVWVEMEGEARSLWQAYAEEGDLPRRGVEMLNAFLADLGRAE